jgi:predicted nucleic acid-binding protein
MLRVVHDTNVAVSALLFRAGKLAWLRDAWAAGAVVPVVCGSTIAELERVLFYPKFDLDADDVTALLAAYLEHAETRPNPGASVRVPRCRDEMTGSFCASPTPPARTRSSPATQIS